MHKDDMKQKETTFFISYALEGKVEKNSILETANNLTNQIINENELDEKKIRELSINYTREESKVLVNLEYYKFDLEELKSRPVEKQIHTVLVQMGFSEKDIFNIEYRKYWINSDEKVWVARVYDEDYDEAFSEFDSYRMREIEGYLMKTAKKVLGFTVYFDFY